MNTSLCRVLPLVLPAMIGTAGAVTTFTESFNTNASAWLTGASTAPTHSTAGGVGDSGYISYTPALPINATAGSFGAPFTQLMFRGNNANDASGDAFVGNWIADGVQTLTLSLRHNNATSLDFYARIAGAGGAGASVSTGFTVLPNVWTNITIPIVDDPSSFVSYGSSTFNGVFTNVQNLQIGLYLPEGTYENLTMDIDNVAVTVPEPSSALLGCAAMGLAFIRRRRA